MNFDRWIWKPTRFSEAWLEPKSGLDPARWVEFLVPTPRWEYYAATEKEARALAKKHGGEVVLLREEEWWQTQVQPFEPIKLKDGWRIVSTEEELKKGRAGKGGEKIIWLPPERAFGTGTHGTTRLCTQEVLRLSPVKSCLDAGTGSGLLAIVAARARCKRVAAFDNDAVAVRVAKQNAKRNLAEVELFRAALGTAKVTGRYDLVIANILSGPVVKYSQWLSARVAPGGRLILSGFKREEYAEVRAAYAALAQEKCSYRDGWCCLTLQKPLRSAKVAA